MLLEISNEFLHIGYILIINIARMDGMMVEILLARGAACIGSHEVIHVLQAGYKSIVFDYFLMAIPLYRPGAKKYQVRRRDWCKRASDRANLDRPLATHAISAGGRGHLSRAFGSPVMALVTPLHASTRLAQQKLGWKASFNPEATCWDAWRWPSMNSNGCPK